MLKTWIRWLLCAAGATVGAAGIRPIGTARLAAGNPFEFFAPWVVISDSEKRRLERDEVVVRMLHGGDGQLAVFVATRLKAPPDALAAWTRAIAELKRSRFVLAVGRFSEPPTTAIRGSVRRCRGGGGHSRVRPRQLRLETFGTRDDVAERRPHPAALHGATPCNASFGVCSWPAWMRIARVGWLAWDRAPIVRRHARGTWRSRPSLRSRHISRAFPPSRPGCRAIPPSTIRVSSPSFTGRWDTTAAGSRGSASPRRHRSSGPNRHLPAVLVAGKQLFATHYVEGGLGLTLVTRDGANGEPYLVYVNRSQLDLLRGFFGGLARACSSRVSSATRLRSFEDCARASRAAPRGSGSHGAIRLGRKTPVGGASRMCCSKYAP